MVSLRDNTSLLEMTEGKNGSRSKVSTAALPTQAKEGLNGPPGQECSGDTLTAFFRVLTETLKT